MRDVEPLTRFNDNIDLCDTLQVDLPLAFLFTRGKTMELEQAGIYDGMPAEDVDAAITAYRASLRVKQSEKKKARLGRRDSDEEMDESEKLQSSVEDESDE